jgi:hypothetical protein
MKFLNDWKLIILICLTLGLAPYYPEPHLWGKIRWLAGGAKGMEAMDYFDVLLHGTPFILLIRLLILKIWPKKQA